VGWAAWGAVRIMERENMPLNTVQTSIYNIQDLLFERRCTHLCTDGDKRKT